MRGGSIKRIQPDCDGLKMEACSQRMWLWYLVSLKMEECKSENVGDF